MQQNAKEDRGPVITIMPDLKKSALKTVWEVFYEEVIASDMSEQTICQLYGSITPV